MSTMVTEFYDALRQGDLRAEMGALRAELADLRVELIKWNVGAMAVLTAIFATIVRLT